MDEKTVSNVQSLIAAIAPKIKEQDEAQGQKSNFNIFYSTGIWHKEIYICRLLCDLLSPKGTHGLGSLLLSLFNNTVLENTIGDDEFGSVVVTREDLTDENRRIDLLIKTNKRFIPFEVKIFAGDQYKQCVDYYEEIERRQKIRKLTEKTVLYYLTPDGHHPSVGSKGYLKENEHYKVISFEKDIVNWLEDCLKDDNVKQHPTIKFALLQFKDVISEWRFTMGQQEDIEIFSDIQAMDADGRNCAIRIWRSLESRKNEMWNLFVEGFANRFVSVNQLKPVENSSYVEYWYKCGQKISGHKVDVSFILYTCAMGTFAGFRTYIDEKLIHYKKADISLQDFYNIFPGVELEPHDEYGWPWIHIVTFPPFGEENSEANIVDFYGFKGKTMNLLFVNNLNEYLERYFVPFVKKLTGWKEKELSCDKETQVDLQQSISSSSSAKTS